MDGFLEKLNGFYSNKMIESSEVHRKHSYYIRKDNTTCIKKNKNDNEREKCRIVNILVNNIELLLLL